MRITPYPLAILALGGCAVGVRPSPRASAQVVEAVVVLLNQRVLPDSIPLILDVTSLTEEGNLSSAEVRRIADQSRHQLTRVAEQPGDACATLCVRFFLDAVSVRADMIRIRAQWRTEGTGRCGYSYAATFEVVKGGGGYRVASVSEEDRSHCGADGP